LSNIIKPVYFNISKETKKVINTDNIMREKPEFSNCNELPEDFVFVPGINVINIDQIIAQQKNEAGEEAKETAKEVVTNAQDEADKILDEAQVNAEQIKNEAYETGYREGYDEGMAAAEREVEAMKQELVDKEAVMQEEFNALVSDIEPQFAAIMGDLITKITGVVIENTDVLHYLIDRNVKEIPPSDAYYIHVSQEDYPRVCGYKNDLIKNVPQTAVFEIVEDAALKVDKCIIETSTHMIDCSLDTQLNNLKQELRLLSIS